MKKILICFIIISSSFSSWLIALPSDTLRLYYDINISTLNSSQFEQIDSFLKANNMMEISAINIIAYADFMATDAYNKALSQHRADNVKNYIYAKLDSKLINKCIGKGELPPELTNQPLGIAENRRVEIILQHKPKIIKKSKSIELSKAKEGEHIVMNNLNFQPGRHFLTSVSQPELEIILNTLVENPKLEIEIQGHICCEFVGKDGYDQDTYTWDLSLHRAKYIYDYLINNKIAPERLQYKGFGSSKPLVYPEKTMEDENINRRVEIVIVKK
jgi:outer membrane protein OmpA-like peptidoglycan-associated protein